MAQYVVGEDKGTLYLVSKYGELEEEHGNEERHFYVRKHGNEEKHFYAGKHGNEEEQFNEKSISWKETGGE